MIPSTPGSTLESGQLYFQSQSVLRWASAGARAAIYVALNEVGASRAGCEAFVLRLRSMRIVHDTRIR